MPLSFISKLIESELAAFDVAILQELNTDISLIKELCYHIIKSGGKRLRPLLVILAAKVFDYQGYEDIRLAVAMEYFHTATLLHDDVIDNSSLRRGKKTANAIWGSKTSVLVGDFLFTRAFQLLAKNGQMQISKVLADTSNIITRGEVVQLINCRDLNINQDQYMDVIRSKTAALFSAAAQMGALLTCQKEEIVTAMSSFGTHLGNAFQLIDDALDYCAKSESLGKNIGDDLAEGKATLPLIYAYHQGNSIQQAAIKKAMSDYNPEDLPIIQAAIQETRAIDYTYQLAREEIDVALNALESIPHSQYKDALIALAHFSVDRQN